MENPPDEELLARYLAGDAAAFAELYERHYPRLVRVATKRIRDAGTAEDIAQEVFLRALRAVRVAGRLSDPRGFVAWMSVIARRLTIDTVRRETRRPPAQRLPRWPQQSDHEPAAEAEVLDSFDREALRRAFLVLSPRYRAVVALRMAGLSYDDIAKRLGVTPATVPPLLFRARSALWARYREISGPECVAPPALLLGLLQRSRAVGTRLRDSLPDPGMVAASLLCLALSTPAAIPGAMPGLPGQEERPVARTMASSVLDLPGGRSGSDRPDGQGRGRSGGPAPGRPGDSDVVSWIGRARPSISVDPREYEQRRARAREQSDYVVETEHGGLYLDPDGDVEWTRRYAEEGLGMLAPP